MSGIFKDAAPLRVTDEGTDAAETVPVTAVEPDGHARGGIVVLHESREFTDSMTNLMQSLANEGWIAVAPYLFHRAAEDSDAEVFGDTLFDDFDACFDWLTSRGVFKDCVGVLGFDDAGTAALLVATNRPIGAAVSVAARGIVAPLAEKAPALVDAAPQLQAPWLGLYGEDDPEAPPDHVEKLRDAIAKASVATNIVSYGGLRHRADTESGTASGDDYESSAEVLVDAQTRIFDWFDSNLR